jgi:hypothetical protein
LLSVEQDAGLAIEELAEFLKVLVADLADDQFIVALVGVDALERQVSGELDIGFVGKALLERLRGAGLARSEPTSPSRSTAVAQTLTSASWVMTRISQSSTLRMTQ